MVINTHTQETLLNNQLHKETQLKNVSLKLFKIKKKVVAQSNSLMYFLVQRLLRWKVLNLKKNADPSLVFTKTLSAWAATTSDKSSV